MSGVPENLIIDTKSSGYCVSIKTYMHSGHFGIGVRREFRNSTW